MELLYGENSPVGRQQFAQHCQVLLAEAWNGEGDEQRAATEKIVKLFDFFEKRKALDDLREFHSMTFLYCQRLRKSQPERFKAAKNAKSGRPHSKSVNILFCLLVENALKQNPDLGAAINEANLKIRERRKIFSDKYGPHSPQANAMQALPVETGRKYYERFRTGQLFSETEIQVSREMLFPPPEPHSGDSIESRFEAWLNSPIVMG